jgi:hypothetical protein
LKGRKEWEIIKADGRFGSHFENFIDGIAHDSSANDDAALRGT